MISVSWNDDVSVQYLLIIVPIRYRLIGFDRVDQVLVLVITGIVG